MTRKEKREATENARQTALACLLSMKPKKAIEDINRKISSKPQEKAFWLNVKARLLCNPVFNMAYEDERKEAEDARRAEEYAQSVAKAKKGREQPVEALEASA